MLSVNLISADVLAASWAKKRKQNIFGRRFGRLVVVGVDVLVGSHWLVQCDCGNRKSVKVNALTDGRQVSCGCWKAHHAAINSRVGAAKAGATRTRHGRARRDIKDRAYSIWEGMVQRCTNQNAAPWKYYGAKGVQVCERWRTFDNFLADMGEPPAGLTLDRINPFGNYEPSNCRWATYKEQANNKRVHHAERR